MRFVHIFWKPRNRIVQAIRLTPRINSQVAVPLVCSSLKNSQVFQTCSPEVALEPARSLCICPYDVTPRSIQEESGNTRNASTLTKSASITWKSEKKSSACPENDSRKVKGFSLSRVWPHRTWMPPCKLPAAGRPGREPARVAPDAWAPRAARALDNPCLG